MKAHIINSAGTKAKVICKGQGQISRSHFSQNGRLGGISVSQHILSCQVIEQWGFKGLLNNPFPNKPLFSRVCSPSLLKTLWKKEKLLVTSNFSISRSVFYPSGELFYHFYKIGNFRLQTLSIWKSPKVDIWERAN